MLHTDPSGLRPPDWLNHGVLVYGPRKGGTTLFQNLLDGTPDMLVYPAELKLKYFARGESYTDDIEAYYKKSRVTNLTTPNFDGEAYEAKWAAALRERKLSSFDEFVRFDALAVQNSIRSGASPRPSLWAAKEVGGPTDKILVKWKRMFPKGKALFIVRNNLMVTRAVLNDRKRRGVRLSISDIIHQVLDPLAVLTAQAKYLSDPYVHMLAYEDLVADTEGEMRKIAAFLGIAYSPALTMPTIFSTPQVVRTSSRKTTKVFSTAETWTEGLSLRERLAVKLASRYAKDRPRYGIDYGALRAAIRKKNAILAA